MFSDKQIRNVRAAGGFSHEIQQYEIEEIIEFASSEGLLSDAVSAWGPKGSSGVRLELRLSEEVRVVSGDLDREMFINKDIHATKIENVRYVLEQAVGVFTELYEAAIGARRADWNHVQIIAKDES